jgi:peptidyl-prolyl cis-trans isomerase SurA
MMSRKMVLFGLCMAIAGTGAAAQQKSKVVEEVVARVNSDVITQGDLEKSKAELGDEVRQACPACTPDEVNNRVAAQEKDLLRDLIDNSLMVQRAKDMSINVDTDVVKRLDEIRQQNKIDSMEDLEKKVQESGLDYQDFKDNIKKQLQQQEVVRREVGSKIIFDHSEVLKYYQDHKDQFVLPETVDLRELFISTEGKTDAEMPALKKKADDLLVRIKAGDDFGELAKRFSDGSTAKEGGDLGTYKRGQLAANIEAEVFKLNRQQVTDVLPTKTGFLILQVREHYAAGLQPEEKVESQIESSLYEDKIKPALRDYLRTLREDSYVEVKPGFEDTAAVPGTGIEEVPVTPDDDQAKKGKHLPFSKKNNT